MAVTFSATSVDGKLAAQLLSDTSGDVVVAWAKKRGPDEIALDTRWHILHYLLSGIAGEHPGAGPTGAVIFPTHRLSWAGAASESPFWLLTPDEVAETANGLATLNWSVITGRYEDIATRAITGLYWQDTYGDRSGWPQMRDGLEALKALHQHAATAARAVVNILG